MLQTYRNYRTNQPDYFCGWHYLLSPKFRTKVHQKWGGNPFSESLCIIGGLTGMVLTSGIFILVTMTAWQVLTS